MAFSSMIFLCLFLPLFLLIYWRAGTIERRNRVLLAFSLIFYVFGGVGYLILLLIMTAVVWRIGLLIGEFKEEGDGRSAGLCLAAGTAICLAVLGVFKYTGFFVSTFTLGKAAFSIALPLGISFYTFKLISYMADVRAGKCAAETNYANLLLYTSLFHQVSEGPIARYPEMKSQFARRKMTLVSFSNGIWRFSVGLAKKVILADHCGDLAEAFFPAASAGNHTVLAVWLGSAFYMMQIYLDFSAYTDMALGLGRMIGFRYPENFNYPYIAASVRDFWRRWHITLSSFFRDYVYFPLGGSRCSVGRCAMNLLIVWALTGLWHGASWNFVLWGLYYFVFIFIEHMRKERGAQPLPAVLGHVLTLLCVYFSWVLFRFTDFSQLGAALGGFIGIGGSGIAGKETVLLLRNNIFFTIYAALACTPFFVQAGKWVSTAITRRRGSHRCVYFLKAAAVAALLIISIMAMTSSSYTPFLYNQF